jgi:hypothetical protein
MDDIQMLANNSPKIREEILFKIKTAFENQINAERHGIKTIEPNIMLEKRRNFKHKGIIEDMSI